jgi:hypothetical protein
MDFAGAQTLIGDVHAGAVICLGWLIFAGIRMMSGCFQNAIPGLFGALFGAGVLGWCSGLDWLTYRAVDVGLRDHDQAGRTVADQSGHEQAQSQARAQPLNMAIVFVSDLSNMYIIDSTVLMATQEDGKIRIGQATGSATGVNFDRLDFHTRVREQLNIDHHLWHNCSKFLYVHVT